MPKNGLAALSAAALLSGAVLVTPAAAMTLTPLLGVARPDTALFQPVANVCGINGCAPIHVKRVRKPPAGFVKRAAPLVFPIAGAQQTAPAKN